MEPSGIFDVDEFFDALREEPLDQWYEIGSVIAVVDAGLESELSRDEEYLLASEVADAGCVFSGDTLFAESVGRSDFPGGSTSALVRAVKEKLFLLPDDTLVCPGHGEETTIGHEKKYNPFV